jgi:UDP-N-acetylmuramoyl-tripeptide--D-alanyl-D-alanine ligase
MKAISLDQLSRFVEDAQIHGGQLQQQVTRVTTDSRQVQPGDVFVALKGDRFDAHDFIPQVIQAGAAAVLVQRGHAFSSTGNCAVIECADSLLGLQQMARGYRAWHQPLVIGLTGSNGKTSTKDLTASILAQRYQTRATLGNLNNHIGLPLTLLSLQDGDECAVVEMGMNHAGEIRVLTDIAQPDAAIVTNIGIAHIEHLGSQDAIAWEKATLPTQVHAEGTVVLNANDPYSSVIARHCQADVLLAGVGSGDISAHDVRSHSSGTAFKLRFPDGDEVEVSLPILGTHMVANAALAAAMGWMQNVSTSEISTALSSVSISKGRMQVKRTKQSVTFIDDSYNANPDSMAAGLRALAEFHTAGRKVAVLGRMGELGDHAAEGYRKVGLAAAQLCLDEVIALGPEAAAITEAAARAGLAQVHHFSSHAEAAEHLRRTAKPADVILLKGSRSAAMETIYDLYTQA